MNQLPVIVAFQSSILQLDLYPDSRGYVLFRLRKHVSEDGERTTDLISLSNLTCEYITDLLDVSINAARWIDANCDHITTENRHLYYRFKQPTLDAFFALQGTDVSRTIQAVLREIPEPSVSEDQSA